MGVLEFDGIVVGAGPAGVAAAVTMARGGMRTLMIEKGRKPGVKNVMGGVLYTRSITPIFPEFYQNATLIERPVVEENFWFLTKDSALKFGFRSQEFNRGVPNAFTVLRVKLDEWAAKEAKNAGALLLPSTRVDDLLREDGQIVGVRTDRPEGDIRASVVVLAEGANPFLAIKAGLVEPLKSDRLALAVKEIISLPKDKIEERFHLNPGDGATLELFGDAVGGLLGYAFIYTNKDSLSVGLGAILSDFLKNRVKPYELLENFKVHPVVKPLLEGGKPMEYMAHLIPEAGLRANPRFYADGVMVAGDAAMMVNAVHREGSNFAFASGRMAGETAVEAFKRGDFSARTLSAYERRLKESFILKDLKKYRNLTPLVERKKMDFLKTYPEWLVFAIQQMLSVDGVSKGEKEKRIKEALFKKKSLLHVASDVYQLWKAFHG